MTYHGGSPFGSSPSGNGQGGPFGSSPLNSHSDRAAHQPGPSAGAPFSGAAASPPPSVKPAGQSHGVTVAWIAAALALVVGLGGGGAAAVNALSGSSAAPTTGTDVSDALVIDDGASDVAEGLAPGSGTEVEDNAERAEIYRNSSDYQFLAGDAGALMPGAMFITASGASCSSGWFVKEESSDAVYMTTAGHCVEEGEEIAYRDTDGALVPAGRAVLTTGFDLEGDLDYGLIELYSDARWEPTIPVEVAGQVEGIASAEWVEDTKPYICRLGYRSGLSCGDFIERESTNVIRYENISDHGDSGGPVWAQDPGTGAWYAVGITSFGEETDATSAGAMVVAPLVAANDFKLLIPGPA